MGDCYLNIKGCSYCMDRLRSVVLCDEGCGALQKPKSKKELKKAYRHWKDHSEAGGCSHGS